MKDVPFTQYLRPDGRKVPVTIDRPDDIADKAFEIIAKGFRFECEQLTTGHVSFTVADDDGDVGIEICMNGVNVPEAVDTLINRVYGELCETHKEEK
jgi:hypothetical protein